VWNALLSWTQPHRHCVHWIHRVISDYWHYRTLWSALVQHGGFISLVSHRVTLVSDC